MSDDIINPGIIEEPKRRSSIADFFIRLVKQKPLGTLGAIIVLLMFFTGIFAHWLAPYPYAEPHLPDALSAPSAQYLLGTDDLGRDILSRIIYGARISMIVGIVGSGLMILVATAIGLFSGFLGGKVDLLVQRFVDAFMSFPSILLVLSLMSIFGAGIWQLILVVGTATGIMGSRIVRGAVIDVKQNTYVEAASAIGCSTWRLLIKHILPHVMAPIIILFTTNMANIILLEATISFLGYGIPPPTPSWGSMVSGSGQRYMLIAPWMVIWPGLALAIVVYGINMFGDAMRDLLDPRLRRGLGRYGKAKIKRSVTESRQRVQNA
jgi:peptide/nickel transport system permease protein